MTLQPKLLLTALALLCAMAVSPWGVFAEPPPPELSDPAIVAVAPTNGGAHSAAVDPETGRVYLPNLGSSDVSVFGSDGTLVTHVSTPSRVQGWGPEAVAIDSQTDRVFVVDTTGDITVLDKATNTVLQRVEVNEGGGWPQTASIVIDHGTRQVFSSVRLDEEKLVRVDADTLEVQGSYPSLRDPLPMGIDESLHRVYVPDAALDQLSVIDSQTGDLQAPIKLTPEGPFAAIADPATHRVYVTAETSGLLWVIDPEEGKVLQTIDVPGCYYLCAVLAINPASQRLYYMTQSELLTIDTVSNQVIAKRTFPGLLGSLVVDPERNQLYITGGFNLSQVGHRNLLIILDTAQLDTSPSPAHLPLIGGPPTAPGYARWLTVGAFLAVLGLLLIGRTLQHRRTPIR